MAADRVTRASLALCAGLLVLAALYAARSIVSPVAFALFAITIVWPFQRALQDWMPRLVALLLSMLVTCVVVVALIVMIAWGFGMIGQWLVRNATRFQTLYSQATEWLEAHGIPIVGLLVERFDVLWLVRVLQDVAARLNSLIGYSLLVLVFMMLGLLEGGDLRPKIAAMAPEGRAQLLVQTGNLIAAKFRRYMLVRTLASVLTGVLVWAFALLAGLELAAAWGVIAFALNYVPFIGPFVATVIPALFATAQFESWQMGLLVILGMTVIQFCVGSYLEPRLAGAALTMSPFVVVFAVFFWALVWGIPGAIIGVPVMIAFITVCHMDPATRWIAILLSGHPKDAASS